MARIVSGLDERDPAEGFMTAYDAARKRRMQGDDDQREQMRLMLQVQRAYAEHQQEQAKSQQLLNEQAQMGSAEALQQLSMQMQAGAHPGAKIIKDAMGTMSRISDPKAFAAASHAFKAGLGEVQKRQKIKAAETAIQRALKNGLIDDAGAQALVQRGQSGEDPQNITQELAKTEHEQTVQHMAAQKAEEALAHAEELVKHAPPGRNKLLAQYKLTRYKNSPHDQAQPGSDAKMLEDVQEALLGSAADAKAQAEARKQHLQEKLGPGSQAPGLGGMTTDERTEEMKKEPSRTIFNPRGVFGKDRGIVGGPDIPPFQPSGPQAHATVKGQARATEGPQKGTSRASGTAPVRGVSGVSVRTPELPKDKILAAKSEEEVLKAMRAAGSPVNAETIAAAMNLWRPSE